MVGMDNTGTWHWLSNDGNGGTGTLDDLYVLWKSGSTVSNGVAWKEGSGDITSVPDMFECYEEEDAPDTAPAKKAPAETEPATKRPVETPSKPDGNEDFSALKTPSNPSSVAYEIPRLEEKRGGVTKRRTMIAIAPAVIRTRIETPQSKTGASRTGG